MWNNPGVSVGRRRRAVFSGVWAFALTLVVACVWGFAHTLKQVQREWDEFRTVDTQLSALERALTEMERALLGLSHAGSPRTRFAGYDPARLFKQLQSAHDHADQSVSRISQLMASRSDLALQQSLMRLELEWGQVRSRLADYLAGGAPTPVSLSALRTFRAPEQETLVEALHRFKRIHRAHWEVSFRKRAGELAGYSVGAWLGLLLVGGIGWVRGVLPARWLREALQRPSLAARYEARLLQSEWAEVYRTLRFQEQRLREVEIFIRDLAMGRTPQPLTRTDAADSLARSGEWLLRRIERLSRDHREAV